MTHLLEGDAIAALAHGLISAKKQQGPLWLDLTVRHIRRVDSAGSLDFGGSEFQPSGCTGLLPEKKSAEEAYGWWHLEHGLYLVEFNECINPGDKAIVLVVPHARLLSAGASHAAVAVGTLDVETQVLLTVGPQGLAVKENARVSRALVMSGQIP